MKKKKKKKKNTVNVLKISTHSFLFLQNTYKYSCSPRTNVEEIVLGHLYKAMVDSLRQQLTSRPRRKKSLTAIDRDILVPCVRI